MADGSEVAGATARSGTRAPPSDRPDIRTVLLALIALVVIGWGLRATGAVVIPLVSSILIALAVMPVRDRVRDRMPDKLKWLGVTSAMALILLVVALFFGALWLAAQQVIAEFPSGEEIAQMLPQDGSEDEASGGDTAPALPLSLPGDGAEAGAEAFSDGEGSGLEGMLSGSGGDLASRMASGMASVLGSVATTVLNSAVGLGSALVIIFFFTLLILIESGDWRRKIATITHPRDEWRLTESAEVIAQKIRAYLLIRAALGVITAALYGLWLWFFGAGLILVWVILTFLLNFIPTVGSIIAGLLPVIYVFMTQDIGTAVAVGLGILVIEQVMGNYVDPKVEGKRVSVSPLVVLVGLLAWSWIWGIPGALLAVPVTVALVVLGAHVPVLRPWALLLSDRTDMKGLKDATRPD
ncbi:MULTISPECIES: AI-2E family transporter [unclassified Paracoccus (in: a-proteobacteria)]|uniref:AI-2E family transporter n=1 Tax=unclassified Paracoccus (in: a-proteobacteria) TaxID=2688777 RepID=UPI00160476E1|nr:MULTISPECIES: AI-2E family transporter [unclassified Paracoccus (in: a-proteobacteria)]MBB1490939.1 AI-2E family transporter [Paracoccus sp. MC1854]MBB1497717.1 AI-2E family transporter [Paracoccus sp. MC1862]QQO45209.1 AI-2E family transporter [Paracoccus sp. MC1862]